MRRYTGIKKKFFLAFLFVGVVSAFLVGYQTYSGAKKLLVDSKTDGLMAVCNLKIQEVENFISSLYLPLQVFSSNSSTRQAVTELSNDFKSLNGNSTPALIEECSKSLTNIYFKKYLFDNDNKASKLNSADILPKSDNGKILQCAYISKISNAQSILEKSNYNKTYNNYRQYLTGFYTRWHFFDIFLLDNNGNILYKQNQDFIMGGNVYDKSLNNSGLNVAYKKALNAHDDLVHFVDFSKFEPASNKHIMFVSSAVYQNDKQIGVVVASFDATPLNKIVSAKSSWRSEGLGKTGEAIIFGADHSFRVEPRLLTESKESFMRQLEESAKVTPDVKELIKKNNTAVGVLKVVDSIAIPALAGETGTIRLINYIGNDVVTVYAPLNHFDLRWGLAVNMTNDELELTIDGLRTVIIKSVLIILAVVLILTYLLSEIFTKPVKLLRESMVSIAAGNYNTKLHIESNDEFTDLADSLNLMSENIKENSESTKHSMKLLEVEIKERIAKEVELKIERNFISNILDAPGMMVFVIDSDDLVVKVNKSGVDISGFSLEAILGQYYLGFYDVEYQKAVTDAVQKVRDGGKSPYVFAKGPDIKGETICADWTFALIPSIEGSSDFIVGIGVDVTERYEIQKTLKENEEMMQLVTSFAQDAMIVSNGDDEIVIWNTASAKLFGYQIDEIKNKSLAELIIDPKDISIFHENIAKMFQAESEEVNTGVTLELVGINKFKNTFALELSITLVLIKNQWNTLYIARDISLRKTNEEKLNKALEKAKSAEQAKSDFLSNMSHEIRTPLNGIIGFLNLLKQTELSDAQSEYLNIIDSSTESLLGIINEILDFSKIESGKMLVEHVEFNPYQDIEQVAELYLAKANEKDIDLIVKIDTDTPATLVGDPLRIRQILSNLLSNALKFTDNGGTVFIIADASGSSATTCVLKLSVRDTGIGINRDKQASIFEAFSQADSSVTRKYGGTGLGLAICSKLAVLMGTSLQLDSNVGEGSEFSFTLTLPISYREPMIQEDFSKLKMVIFNCGAHKADEDILIYYLDSLKCHNIICSNIDELKSKKNIDTLFIFYSDANVDIAIELKKLYPNLNIVMIAKDIERNKVASLKLVDLKQVVKPINISKISSVLNDIYSPDGMMMRRQFAVKSAHSNAFSGKVIVVEDNAINRKLIDIMLSQLGISVELAENGRVAVDRIKENKYDIIFMDIHMPVLDGVSATIELLDWEHTNGLEHTPIVALTANVIEEDQAEYFKVGMDDFLAKPINAEQLKLVLNKYLKDNEVTSLAEACLTEDEKLSLKAMLDGVKEVVGVVEDDIAKYILREFYTLTLSQVLDIKNALDTNNLKLISDTAFSIKGVALNLKLQKIADYAGEIAQSAARGADFDYNFSLSYIDTEIKKIKRLINDDKFGF